MPTPDDKKRLEEIEELTERLSNESEMCAPNVEVDWLCSELREAWKEIKYFEKISESHCQDVVRLQSRLAETNVVISELMEALGKCANYQYFDSSKKYQVLPTLNNVRDIAKQVLRKVKEMRK